MTVTLPRLDRDSAAELLARHRGKPMPELRELMPLEPSNVTFAPLGGQRMDRADLAALRVGLLEIATDHGMPGRLVDAPIFEGRSARLVRERLPITPHEASEEGIWSFLTSCWLLDIAIWRFGPDASDERFVGHINRNTFRRMWWRAEVLGEEIDLTLLGEDELVNIMERPTLFTDPRLAKAIAAEFLERVLGREVNDRMRLMRESTKRILRLTPFLAFDSLDDQSLRLVVQDAFDAAVTGIYGATATMPSRSGSPRAPSSELEELARVISVPGEGEGFSNRSDYTFDLGEIALAAMDVAERVGRVTNASLRETAPISNKQAREVFRRLLDDGQLVRRGTKRGTHYVLPDEVPVLEEEAEPVLGASPAEAAQDPVANSALRRLLKRPGG